MRKERHMDEKTIQLYKSIFTYELEIDREAISQTIEERLKGIPVFGDVLTFIEKRQNIIEMNGLNRAVDSLKELVLKLVEENKVDRYYIENCQRELYFIFKFFLSAVYNQPNEEFIDYLSHYVCSCISEEFSDVKIKVNILNKIAKYTKQHIAILKFTYDDSRKHGWPDNLKNDDYNWQKQVEQIENIEPFIITYCFNELVNDGFIFQMLGTFNSNTFSPYEITELGEKCLKMLCVDKEELF